MTRSTRLLFAAVWSLAVVVVTGVLAFEVFPSFGTLPDAVHIAAHLGLFAVLSAVLANEIGALRAVMVVLAVGAVVEVVQMVGIGIPLWAEASFDLAVDGLGALLGVRASRAEGGRRVVAIGLHPAFLVAIAVAVAGYPPLWFMAIIVVVGISAIPSRGEGWPWPILVPLLFAIPVVSVSVRSGLCFVLVALMHTLDSEHPRRWAAWFVAWVFVCAAWAVG